MNTACSTKNKKRWKDLEEKEKNECAGIMLKLIKNQTKLIKSQDETIDFLEDKLKKYGWRSDIEEEGDDEWFRLIR